MMLFDFLIPGEVGQLTCYLWFDKWYFRSQITNLITLREWESLWDRAYRCSRCWNWMWRQLFGTWLKRKPKVFSWFFVRYVHIPICMPQGTLLISYVIENIAFNTCNYHTGRLVLDLQIFKNQVAWSLRFFIQNTSVYFELHVSQAATVGQSLLLSHN